MTRAWPLLLFVLGCGGPKVTAQQLNDELNLAVPHLASPGRVIAVLDSLHIDHSSYDPGNREITGHARSIHVAFVFDEQGRLRQRTIRSGSH